MSFFCVPLSHCCGSGGLTVFFFSYACRYTNKWRPIESCLLTDYQNSCRSMPLLTANRLFLIALLKSHQWSHSWVYLTSIGVSRCPSTNAVLLEQKRMNQLLLRTLQTWVWLCNTDSRTWHRLTGSPHTRTPAMQHDCVHKRCPIFPQCLCDGVRRDTGC